MTKKKRLAILVGCMLIYSSWGSVALADNSDSGNVEEVDVWAAKFHELNPVKYTVITADELKAKGAQTVADALKDIPGLYVTGNDVKGTLEYFAKNTLSFC